MRRRSGDERRSLAESIQRLVDEDKSVKKVAVELGIRRSTVRRYRKNYAGQLLPQSPSTGTPSAPTNATPASGGISPAV
jgi:transposase-like protein